MENTHVYLPEIDRFAEAAKRAQAPVEVFRLWALRYLRGISNKQWSHWETGEKAIPEKHIIKFLTDPRSREVAAELERERLAYLRGAGPGPSGGPNPVPTRQLGRGEPHS